MATHAHRGVLGPVVSADPWRRSSGRPHESWRAAGLAGTEQCRAGQSCARTAEVNAPGVESSRHHRAPTRSCGRELSGVLQECVGPPTWSSWSIREQWKGPQASTSSCTTATRRDEHPRQQSGFEVPVSVPPEGAPPTEGDKCKGRSTAHEGPSLWRQEAEKESQNWQRCFLEKAKNRPGQQ